MKKIKFALKNIAVLSLLVSSFVACDKDYSTLGSDIVGQNNFEAVSEKYDVTAFTHVLGGERPVQTNNLPVNKIGVFKDPTYGLTTANFVSQLGATAYDPDFGESPVLDSVVLNVPYFSKVTETDSEGNSTYELDSIFGDGEINLSIYESNYFLRSFDPSSEFSDPQLYYSNGATSSTGTIDPLILEGTPITTVTGFKPDPRQIRFIEDLEVTQRMAPAMRIPLDLTYWQNKLIDKQGEPELSNANNFNNYFRGLYFKSEAIDDNGSMALLNFASSGANITVYYTDRHDVTNIDDDEHLTYVLGFSGNKVNFLSNSFNFPLTDGNSTLGDEKLYLKGGDGSMAIIDLFNGGNYESGFSPEFEAFKNDFVETDSDGHFVKDKRLINQANLVFYVDQSMVNGEEPNRIYLYDLNKNTALVDYYLDPSISNTNPESSLINHLGVLQRENDEPNGAGIKYKMRITEHLNTLLRKDSTNVKLGLTVSSNVNLENIAIQNKVLSNDDDLLQKIPISSIISPRGTILYGNNTANEAKKLYLEIYYTEPNN